jgi:hypothetical protein
MKIDSNSEAFRQFKRREEAAPIPPPKFQIGDVVKFVRGQGWHWARDGVLFRIDSRHRSGPNWLYTLTICSHIVCNPDCGRQVGDGGLNLEDCLEAA